MLTILFKARLAVPIKTPKWSKQYTVKGQFGWYKQGNTFQMNTFEAWHDKKHGISRIDYNEGAVSQYQFKNRGEFGRFYRIIPNSKKCEQIDVQRKVYGDEAYIVDKRIEAKSVLPDLKNFVYNGE